MVLVVVEGSSSSSISLLVRLVKAVYAILLNDISHFFLFISAGDAKDCHT